MLENKFYKVKQSGGTYVTATLFNPITKETTSKCVRDYDYYDGSRDNDELYYEEINEEVKRAYYRFIGKLQPDDTVEVVKGRKIPIGVKATVIKVYNIYDKYNRYVDEYAYLSCGKSTSTSNLKIIEI